MPQQVAVGLSHRDHYSTGKNRRIFGYEAYHWSILITGEEVYAVDASDASEINPVTMRMTNPKMDWQFRFKQKVDLDRSVKMLGRIVIGQIPDTVSTAELQDFFSRVPMPVKNTEPQQSCVTWVVNAVLALQAQGWAPGFQMDKLKDAVMAYGDERMKGEGSAEAPVKYFTA